MRTGTTKDGEAIEKQLEGEYWSWDYGNREGVSEIQVFRYIETALHWLAVHGIDASRLPAKGFGDARPVADNSNQEGCAKNRLVELAKM